ncbi:endoglucanase [Quercus suber]|uniref:Endoglucanase n=1 Tax=Quercus suber TaxID=58331 RepID=A0AAW0LCA8_QUESU
MGMFFFFSLLSLLAIFPTAIPQTQSKPVMALPLYTNSRWIVDEGGQRVKLACVNWVSRLEPMVTEGLSKQPMDAISKKIASMGFNCVRLTWPLFLVTNDSLASLTVRQSCQSLGLSESIAGIQANNPSIIDLPPIKAYQAVVSSLGANNVKVILENNISKPGDQYFSADIWIKGLSRMATIFNGVSNVVGTSLRNELQGPRQNVNDWYRYMQKGAEAVHLANPDILVIISGLSYDKDLSYFRNQQVNLTFTRKLVYEVNWNGFSDGKAWKSGNPNQVCGREVDNFMRISGFLLDQGWPLLVSEFEMDQRGTNNVNDISYMNCFLAIAAELDLDWRPGLSEANLHKVIFHPSTGLCVLRKSLTEPLRLGACTESEAWSYTPQKTLTLKGTYFCLQAIELGKPAKLGIICTGSNSKWQTISDSKMYISSKVNDGSTACLDVDSDNSIVTNTCKCLSRDDTCDPGSQWFKLVDSTRSSSSAKTFN